MENAIVFKGLMLLTFVCHLLLWHCDRIITYVDGGRFDFKALGDNRRLSKLMGKTPLDHPMQSMVLGAFGLTAMFPGYLALCAWMRQYSTVSAVIMFIGSVVSFLPGVAHHVFCGAVEWMYIRMGETEEARQIIVEFFRKTSSTMVACFVGLMVFAAAFLIPVVAGMTSLPRWAGIFNTLPLFLAMAAFRIVGTGNLAGAIMFAGLFFLM